ncbi:MAG: BtpA/SgcQ family protein [Planctomycetes bacterium]|nr:BtpA/SgcQ family protein [Planctomycetota bacterium]
MRLRRCVARSRPYHPLVQGDTTGRGRGPSLTVRSQPWLIGVLHLPALPGAPAARLSVDVIARQAAEDALVLAESGFTAVMVENFHDVPFHAECVGPETVAAMAVITAAVREAVDLPVGVNVLRNDALAALGVAVATGASFLRVNVLAGAAVTDQGLVQGRADALLRRRTALGADVAILADVDCKHATSLDTRPQALRAADLVRRAGADAVLVTGQATGLPVDLEILEQVAQAVSPTPTLAASGTTPETLAEVLARCSGVVVGTALKDPESGRIDRVRASAYTRRRNPWP